MISFMVESEQNSEHDSTYKKRDRVERDRLNLLLEHHKPPLTK